MQAIFGRVSASLQMAAAVLVAVSALRFAFVTGVVALEHRPQSSASVSRPAVADNEGRAPLVPVPPASASETPRQPKVLPLVRSYLVVTDAPDRSEVYVNGARIGRVPFVGDHMCREGERLAIEILPPRGVPVVHQRACYAGEIRIVR